MDVPSSWDALNKQARKQEAQLDEQMHSYRKLVSTKGSTKVAGEENDLESGVDWLLKQLQQVNEQMQDWVSSGGSEMVSHTSIRHQEILQDLTQIKLYLKNMHPLVKVEDSADGLCDFTSSSNSWCSGLSTVNIWGYRFKAQQC